MSVFLLEYWIISEELSSLRFIALKPPAPPPLEIQS